MIYDFKVLLEGGGIETRPVGGSVDIETEAMDKLKNTEQKINDLEKVEWFEIDQQQIDSNNKVELEAVKQQADVVLQNFNQLQDLNDDNCAEAVAALQNYLKAQSLLNTGINLPDGFAIDWDINSILSITRDMNPDIKQRIFWAIWSAVLAKLSTYREDRMDDAVKIWTIENETGVDIKKAWYYLRESFLHKINTTEQKKGETKLQAQYRALKGLYDQPNFVNAVCTIIDEVCWWDPRSTLNFDDKYYSDVVAEFQNKILSEWTKEEKDLLFNGMNNKKKVDWKLWFNTLKLLIQKSWVGEKLDFEGPEGPSLSVDNLQAKETVELDTWTNISKMPLTMADLSNFWQLVQWWTRFEFYNWSVEIDGKKPDFVKTQPWTNEKFIRIGNENYFIDPQSEQKNRVEQSNIIDVDWSVLGTKIQIWTFNDGKFNWTEIVVDLDGKEKRSTKFDEVKRRPDNDEWVEWQLWVKRFRWKWRIDMFEGGDDTKRISKEQLKNLDKDDLNWILDESINAYKEVKHKPSWIWQTNLERITFKILKDTGINDKFSDFSEDAERVSDWFLGLKFWFGSNFEKDLREKDQEKTTEELCSKLWDWFDVSDIADFNKEEKTQGDRLLNRLLILKKYVDFKFLLMI